MDLRFAIRYLRRNAGFTIGAVLVLALGMGANTAMFSVINAVLLRPLPFGNPERIVALETRSTQTGRTGQTVSGPDFHDWERQSASFEAMAYHIGGEVSAVINGRAEYVEARLVTPGFFRVFGLPSAAGRLLTKADAQVPVAVVSYRWAERHLGGSAAAVGKSIKVHGIIVQVIGVAAPGFHFPQTDLWLPSGLFPENLNRTAHNYTAVGRLKPGVTVEAARKEMELLASRIEEQHPENRFKSVAVSPLQDRLTYRVRTTLLVLLGAVAVVLVIGCANVANLLVARAAMRTREIAVRAAIGASRSRVIRQLVTESLLLAFCGCAAGVLIAFLTVDGLVALAPANIPRLADVRLDPAVLLYSAGIACVASLLFGLVPALQATRFDIQTGLKLGGSKGAASSTTRTTRSALVVIEVALSTVLLIGAALLLRSYSELSKVDLGFTSGHLLITELAVPSNDENEDRRVTSLHRELIAETRALPGVKDAAGVRWAPLGDSRPNAAYWIQGRPEGRPGEYPSADMQVITPRYFATIGAPIRLGRDFTDADDWGQGQVAIINQAFADREFRGRSPLGQRVRTGLSEQSMNWMEIVGVVGNVRQTALTRDPRPELYVPYRQHPGVGSRLSLVTRTTLEPLVLTSAIREVIRRMDREVPVRFETMDEVFARSLSYPRFRSLLIGGFGVLAAVLAMIGIYSVLASIVSQRSAEMGVRMAVGARPRDVMQLVVWDGLKLTGLGLVVGLLAAVGASRLIHSFLYGVSPGDPVTYAAVALLVGTAAVLASTVPALRAARIDPVVALRQE